MLEFLLEAVDISGYAAEQDIEVWLSLSLCVLFMHPFQALGLKIATALSFQGFR